jgi:transposase
LRAVGNDGVSFSLVVARGCEPAETRKTGAKPREIDDGLWARVEPLLPVVPRDWNEAGVWQKLHELLLSELIRGKRGQPLRRPKHLYADRGYDHETYRDQVRRFEITPHIARRGIEHGSGLGVYRWVVEGARTAALVPPPAHPMGDPRRHP